MVSPAADYFPKKTLKVNTTAAQYIVDAVKAQPNSDRIKVVYIGSVAQTGHRNAPVHWGRTGDPINISVYDHYAISKTIAERIFVSRVLNIGRAFAKPVSYAPNYYSKVRTQSHSTYR